jgi:pyridoxine 4-dehydrogenase
MDIVNKWLIRAFAITHAKERTSCQTHCRFGLCDLQIEYSLISRGIEDEILSTCRELGIGVTTYGVLSRGLISGHWTPNRTGSDFRSLSPRFQGSNLQANLAPAERVRAVAGEIGASVAQLAIAWVLAQGADITPLVGARRRDGLAEAIGALDVHLSAEHLAQLNKAVPPGAASGARYVEAQLAQLDSEKRSAGGIP